MKEPHKIAIFLLVILSLLLGYIAISKIYEVKYLLHEKEAYQWRNFTCKTLLDDPVTKQIFCPSHKVRRLK